MRPLLTNCFFAVTRRRNNNMGWSVKLFFWLKESAEISGVGLVMVNNYLRMALIQFFKVELFSSQESSLYCQNCLDTMLRISCIYISVLLN